MSLDESSGKAQKEYSETKSDGPLNCLYKRKNNIIINFYYN